MLTRRLLCLFSGSPSEFCSEHNVEGTWLYSVDRNQIENDIKCCSVYSIYPCVLHFLVQNYDVEGKYVASKNIFVDNNFQCGMNFL